MSMDKHTPGPWILDESMSHDESLISEDYHFIDAGNGFLRNGIGFGISGYLSIADARLIVSAPELLEALDSVLQSLQTGVPETIGYGEQTKKAFSEGWNAAMNAVYERAVAARAALAKARGEA